MERVCTENMNTAYVLNVASSLCEHVTASGLFQMTKIVSSSMFARKKKKSQVWIYLGKFNYFNTRKGKNFDSFDEFKTYCKDGTICVPLLVSPLNLLFCPWPVS